MPSVHSVIPFGTPVIFTNLQYNTCSLLKQSQFQYWLCEGSITEYVFHIPRNQPNPQSLDLYGHILFMTGRGICLVSITGWVTLVLDARPHLMQLPQTLLPPEGKHCGIALLAQVQLRFLNSLGLCLSHQSCCSVCLCITVFTVYSLQLPVSNEHTNLLTYVFIILFVDIVRCIIIHRHLDIATERLKALRTDKKTENLYTILEEAILYCIN